MNLYANPNNPAHAANNATFLRIVKAYPVLGLFQPAPEKAPWHWQAVINFGYQDELLNFWPHTLKGQRDGYRSVEGEHAIRGIIEQALIDAGHYDDFDLIED